MLRFVATTNPAVIEDIKKQQHNIIGVDGTVPRCEHLYDYLFDHHRPSGKDIQMDEIVGNFDSVFLETAVIVTTMVDADAICSAFMVGFQGEICSEFIQLLRAVSYDCDHLTVPAELAHHGREASMIVAALKEDSNALAKELGLPANRRTWTEEQRQDYQNRAFERGFGRIYEIMQGEWDYQAVALPYWETVEKNTREIIAKKLVSEYKGYLVFNGTEFTQYIDPRCFIRAAHQMGYHRPAKPITLTVRDYIKDGKVQGYSYTIGAFPLHAELSKVDLTQHVYYELSLAEYAKNPESGAWGGRKTVGGSPWNNGSTLAPEQVLDIVDKCQNL